MIDYRRLGLRILVAVALLSALSFPGCATIDRDDRKYWRIAGLLPEIGTARVLDLTGTVEVQHPGQAHWVRLAVGDHLLEGAQVRTSAEASAALTLPDSSTVLITENTRFELNQMRTDLRHGWRKIRSSLISGKIRVQTYYARGRFELLRSDITVSTPNGFALLPKTDAVIEYDPELRRSALFSLAPANAPHVAYLDFTEAKPVIVGGGRFVKHLAGSSPPQPQPISTLPLSEQREIASSTNRVTFGSPAWSQPIPLVVPPAQVDARLRQVAISRESSESRSIASVAVYFATDRALVGDARAVASYGSERSPQLRFGVCRVQIPADHRLGVLETESAFIRRTRLLWSYLKSWFGGSKIKPSGYVLVTTLTPLDRDNFFLELQQSITKSARREAMVFIHGYNVTFEDACRRTGQIAYDLEFRGAPIVFSWPSKASYTAYTRDVDVIAGSIKNLENFIESIARSTGAERVHLIAHSMGSRAMVHALASIAQRHSKPVFSQTIFAAPDISTEEFRSFAADFRRSSERTTLYASSKDGALQAAREIVWGYPRAGEAGENLLVIEGIDTIDASNADTSAFWPSASDSPLTWLWSEHSYFARIRSVITDVRDLVLFRRPPDERANLRRRLLRELIYWEFPP